MSSDRNSEATFIRQQLAFQKKLDELTEQNWELEDQFEQVLAETRKSVSTYLDESQAQPDCFDGKHISVDDQCYKVSWIEEEDRFDFVPFDIYAVDESKIKDAESSFPREENSLHDCRNLSKLEYCSLLLMASIMDDRPNVVYLAHRAIRGAKALLDALEEEKNQAHDREEDECNGGEDDTRIEI